MIISLEIESFKTHVIYSYFSRKSRIPEFLNSSSIFIFFGKNNIQITAVSISFDEDEGWNQHL
jgi:hypothetical protein